MSVSVEVLLAVKGLQERYMKSNPFRVQIRRGFEGICIAIIEENLGALSKRQIQKLMRHLNSDFYRGEPRGGRLGLLVAGDTRNRILGNDLAKLNELFLEVYLNENLDVADRLIAELDGVSDGFVSCLLYLKNRDEYNIFIPATAKGVRAAFPDASFPGSFKDRFLLFNKLANSLKQRCGLKSQEMDVILTVLGEQGA